MNKKITLKTFFTILVQAIEQKLSAIEKVPQGKAEKEMKNL